MDIDNSSTWHSCACARACNASTHLFCFRHKDQISLTANTREHCSDGTACTRTRARAATQSSPLRTHKQPLPPPCSARSNSGTSSLPLRAHQPRISSPQGAAQTGESHRPIHRPAHHLNTSCMFVKRHGQNYPSVQGGWHNCRQEHWKQFDQFPHPSRSISLPFLSLILSPLLVSICLLGSCVKVSEGANRPPNHAGQSTGGAARLTAACARLHCARRIPPAYRGSSARFDSSYLERGLGPAGSKKRRRAAVWSVLQRHRRRERK